MPVADDTIWRLYSMTKPVTGVALLSLYERGLFQLDDPVHRYIPEFRGLQVRERDDDGTVRLGRPAAPDVVRDAMMHMTGIGCGPQGARLDLATLGRPAAVAAAGQGAARCRRWSSAWRASRCGSTRAPAGCTRGRPTCAPAWSRSCRASGSTSTCASTIFEPLGMVDTGFSVPEADVDRFAALYRRNAAKKLVLSTTR